MDVKIVGVQQLLIYIMNNVGRFTWLTLIYRLNGLKWAASEVYNDTDSLENHQLKLYQSFECQRLDISSNCYANVIRLISKIRKKFDFCGRKHLTQWVAQKSLAIGSHNLNAYGRYHYQKPPNSWLGDKIVIEVPLTPAFW